MIVKEREAYIAKVSGKRAFPWRMAIIAKQDKELVESNLSYLLATPSCLEDISWIKPGKVAWEWWNDWNLDGVAFKTGVNTETYKAYIDYAASNHVEYVILDEGWAVNLKADLMQIVPELDLKGLIDYAKSKNVGIILWAGYYAFERDMENVCRHYAEMGVKGFKVDFMDRDDQEMVDFNYRAAQTCAKYKLLLDLHGMYKPSGLNRTYPNVLNFEGVHGLENMKWSSKNVDQVKYDVMIPFIRQVAGPIDYTQGAMRNAVKESYYPCYSEPMSQGTRCRQLALYVILNHRSICFVIRRVIMNEKQNVVILLQEYLQYGMRLVYLMESWESILSLPEEKGIYGMWEVLLIGRKEMLNWIFLSWVNRYSVEHYLKMELTHIVWGVIIAVKQLMWIERQT